MIFFLWVLMFTDFFFISSPCKDYSINRKSPGIYSRELGSVNLQDEDCKIIETYRVDPCYKEDGINYHCQGTITLCSGETILTRLTVCPSFQSENQVNQVRHGKFLHEEIK